MAVPVACTCRCDALILSRLRVGLAALLGNHHFCVYHHHWRYAPAPPQHPVAGRGEVGPRANGDAVLPHVSAPTEQRVGRMLRELRELYQVRR